jgi:DNA-binding SARP family transcriptional activator
MARAMELLFLLQNTNAPIRKEQILTLLWPNIDEQSDQTLRSTLYYLRKVLGTACITSSYNGSYALDLAAEYGENVWYDVAVFQDLYALAQASLAAEDEVAAASAFEEMTHLYRGDYLISFYSDWCSMRRDKLRQTYCDAHNQLALIAWRQQQMEKSIFHWQHMLSIDNCLETAHYGLMRCYWQQGKRETALRQYLYCVESLRDELGATPGPDIQRLYRRLLQISSKC